MAPVFFFFVRFIFCFYVMWFSFFFPVLFLYIFRSFHNYFHEISHRREQWPLSFGLKLQLYGSIMIGFIVYWFMNSCRITADEYRMKLVCNNFEINIEWYHLKSDVCILYTFGKIDCDSNVVWSCSNCALFFDYQ